MAESGEGPWMSAKERDRLKVLHEVKERHITQKQAAGELGLSVRWVRALSLLREHIHRNHDGKRMSSRSGHRFTITAN
jgi:hypothetical protein